MNFPFPAPSPYIQATMTQAVQAMMSGGPLPSNCVIMAIPLPRAQQILPQLMMNSPIGGRYYSPPPYTNKRSKRANNYPVVSVKKSKKKVSQPHSNVYNSASFDSYMKNLSWSRLFDHPSRKISKQQNQDQLLKTQQRTDSPTSSTSSTTSDETIRRVDVTHHNNSKQQTNGSLPFKYSSEFLPGINKKQSQKLNSNGIFLMKK
jgi:hypothetical protein